MLELKSIVKDYPAGDNTVHALRGLDLQFRSSEFVAILGQSGCGKTTLLNIIGGLDQYTKGDLVIGGRSTKHFKDRDWDSYRNHSIGFVFQSYNLIPHQSVLQNVELALTLSGVSKSERRKRAKEALEKVGLSDQLKKKPSEMSGGQMQRVAIARAIVNNPDIILADEPTGALDTETSVQVMEILKEISKDRLVIMVTHNPDLANQYATRIIKMLDGKITDDSMPLSAAEAAKEHLKEDSQIKPGKKEKKPSMSLFTSFGLSLKNLFTKKGRTALTAFAGSIGIIGIALIYAVSQGTTTYIDAVQEETLSAYPLTLEAQHTDISSLLTTFMGKAQAAKEHENDAIYQKTMFYDLVNSLNTMDTTENDLKAFKNHLETELKKEDSPLVEAVNGVQYSYDINMLVYTKNVDGKIIQSDSSKLMQDLLLEHFGMDLSNMLSMQESYMGSGNSMMTGMVATVWQEMLSGTDGAVINPMLYDQYDMIYGSWPNSYDEIVLVVDKNNEIDDMTLYALGLKSKADIDELTKASLNKQEVETVQESWSYEEVCDMEFRTILNADCYTYDALTETYTDLRDSEAGLKYLYDNGIDLKVTGIIRPKEDATSSMINGTIGYTHLLTEYIIEQAKDSVAIEAQLKDDSMDIFTGLPFAENTGNLSDDQKKLAFIRYVEELSDTQKAATYVQMMSIPSKEELDAMVTQAVGDKTRADVEAMMTESIAGQTGMSVEEMSEYTAAMSDEEIMELFTAMVTEQVKAQYAMQVAEQMKQMPTEQLSLALDMAMPTLTDEQYCTYYDEVLTFSNSSYEENLIKLGYVQLDSPSSINIYASSFENKDVIEDAILDYNENVDDLEQIEYTDYVGLMMSSITTIINAITYVLIAFVAVSLIVSSIMIGVITLISVQERTKEIGILRAIGASKKNVSSMFNAETVIIGFISGALGVTVTYLLCIPINAILHEVTGIGNLNAILPPVVAGILVAISVILTLFAGIIPSRSAAKKDPVVALRTE